MVRLPPLPQAAPLSGAGCGGTAGEAEFSGSPTWDGMCAGSLALLWVSGLALVPQPLTAPSSRVAAVSSPVGPTSGIWSYPLVWCRVPSPLKLPGEPRGSTAAPALCLVAESGELPESSLAPSEDQGQQYSFLEGSPFFACGFGEGKILPSGSHEKGREIRNSANTCRV